MKTDIWMPLYINDYLADTTHLTAEESGAYLHIIMHYWKKGPIENNIERLSRVSKVSDELTEYLLNEFFTLANGNWIHSRIDKEMNNAKSRRDSARENGKKGGRPPKNNPEKTDGFNEGCNNNNPDSNPQKNSSSSSSSSSSQSNTQSKSKNNTVRFSKPTVKELIEYCKERNNKIDAEYFYNYYESKGWKVGKATMKNWKAAMATWEKNNYNTQSSKTDQYNMDVDMDINIMEA